jgi:phenylacetic acid degradation protein
MEQDRMKVYEIDGIVPVVDPSAFVHPSAVLIGDVVVGAGAYIGPCASLRGDFGRLFIGAGANVQDCCVMHGFPGSDTIVEELGHIGHGAILHGCIVRRNAMVGMNAVVMDNAVVGESAIVAAQSFIKAGMEIPPRMLAAGVPAKVMRELTELEMAWKVEGTGVYLDLVKRCHGTLREVEALSAVEPGRQRLKLPELKTLQATRRDKE